MKFLVLALTLVAAVSARPGVHELGPSGSYLPAGGGGGGIIGGGGGIIGGGGLIGGGGGIIGGGLSGGGFDGGFDGSGFGGGIGIGGGGIGIGGGGIGIGGGGIGIGGGGFGQDQRSVYFYAAPDDEGPARLRINIAPSSARNTKIIFVKAPSYGGVIPEVIAPPSQAVDKTLVYVLVKRPDQGGAITIPSSLGVRQSKPEVYFVKYRNQAEAEQAVASGLSGQAVGAGLSDLGNEGSFVRSLSIGGGGGHIGGIIGGGHLGGGDIGHGIIGGGISTKYGTPGASGPYKR